MTIPEILERRTELAQSSVYRNLTMLEKAEVVTKVVTNSEWGRYELAEDLIGSSPPPRVFGVWRGARHRAAGTARAVDLGGARSRSATRSGFVIEEHRLDLVGRCGSCAHEDAVVASGPNRDPARPGRGLLPPPPGRRAGPAHPAAAARLDGDRRPQFFTAYEELAAKYSFVALDHRGHGRGLRAHFTLEDAADDAAALVEQLGVGPVVLVGYSMGGPISLHLADRHRSGSSPGWCVQATALEWRATRADRLQWKALRLFGFGRAFPVPTEPGAPRPRAARSPSPGARALARLGAGRIPPRRSDRVARSGPGAQPLRRPAVGRSARPARRGAAHHRGPAREAA